MPSTASALNFGTHSIADIHEDGDRRPRIAIMGEFSAGKSTLTNLLLGDRALPTRVTATQLPPVWLSYGQAPSYAETTEGGRFEIDLADPPEFDLGTTRALRVFRTAEILSMCDLIDFPGISDPNMDPEVWQRMVPMADAVLWCTHATQAWRQSEAAVWEDMPEELQDVSLLLLTRVDRLPTERDRRRVVARVTRETEGFFADVLPVSLTQAQAAGQDSAAFAESGASALFSSLTDLIDTLSHTRGTTPRAPNRRMPTGGATTDLRAIPGGRASSPASPQEPPDPVPNTSGRVTPKRVRAGAARAPRPIASDTPRVVHD